MAAESISVCSGAVLTGLCLTGSSSVGLCAGTSLSEARLFQKWLHARHVPGFPLLHILLIFDTVFLMSASLVGLCIIFSYGFNSLGY